LALSGFHGTDRLRPVRLANGRTHSNPRRGCYREKAGQCQLTNTSSGATTRDGVLSETPDGMTLFDLTRTVRGIGPSGGRVYPRYVNRHHQCPPTLRCRSRTCRESTLKMGRTHPLTSIVSVSLDPPTFAPLALNQCGYSLRRAASDTPRPPWPFRVSTALTD